MAGECPKRDEVGAAVDDGLDMLPPPFSGIAKVLRRLGSAIIGRERRKRRARIKRQTRWEQAAGRNRDASSDATSKREAMRRNTERVVSEVIEQELRGRARASSSSGEE